MNSDLPHPPRSGLHDPDDSTLISPFFLSSLSLSLSLCVSLSVSLPPPAYESEDQLLWSPGVLSGQAVEDFLLCSQRRGPPRGLADTPLPGDSVRDNEQVQEPSGGRVGRLHNEGKDC